MPEFNKKDVVVHETSRYLSDSVLIRMVHEPTKLEVLVQGRDRQKLLREGIERLEGKWDDKIENETLIDLTTGVFRAMSVCHGCLDTELKKMAANADYKPTRARFSELHDKVYNAEKKMVELLHREDD